MLTQLEAQGWALMPSKLETGARDRLLGLFADCVAGTRCLLDDPAAVAVARELRSQLIETGVLSADTVAIQAIAFDKTPEANWKVTWHQDVMFPFAQPVTTPGYDLATKKEGVDYARPPRAVLEQMLAVRLHLDDCDETNGPLRVSPGTHREGIIKSTEITKKAGEHGQVMCVAQAGDALLMRPLLLHASSVAVTPKHRRVLHFVFYSGTQMAEHWHRAIAG
jgi:ectoine hydroxylase-related dioxygenase (phytanoyl-CoA dioxygenase family)